MNRLLLFVTCCLSLNLAAQESLKGEYWYELGNVNGEWNQLFIPNHITKEVQGNYSALRIYSIRSNGDTLETPFVIRNNLPVEERTEIDFELYNKSEKDGWKYFTFKTDGKEKLNKVNLEVSDSDFDHRIVFEGSNDGREWFTILKDYRILSLYKDNINFRYTDLEFPSSRYSFFRLQLPSDLEFQRAYLSGTIEEGGEVEEKRVDFDYLENDERQQSEIYIRLNEYQPIHSFAITMDEEIDYFRNASLYYLNDSSFYKDEWHKNFKKIYSGDLTSVRQHIQNFHPVFTTELKFVIYNGNNQSLNVRDIEVKGNRNSMIARFNKENARHFLVYSDKTFGKAYYDIEKFRENIPENLSNLELGRAMFHPFPQQEKEPFFQSNWWIWGILILLIVLIGRFTVQMLKDGV
ncbi:MAG: hypothetical protein AAF487_03995 [Bacteroidota bacterium]